MDECVQHVFSIKIFRKMICDPMASNIQNEIKNIDNNNELRSYMMASPHKETNHPYMSDFTGKTNFIREHNLIHLETEILNNAKEYIYKITHSPINSFENFRVTTSQVIYFPPTFSGMPHAHIPGKLSGVYYFKTPNAAGNFRFINPISYPYDGDDTGGVYEIVPTEDTMMIWPCWLIHKVLPNRSDEMRISISFQIEFDKI